MSATAALKGYRTQFLYSLHYILSNQDKNYQYRLEGEEDLDILNDQGDLLIAIQVKNLNRVLIPSDLVNDKRTSFLRRYVDRYPGSLPRLVSFGPISPEVKSIRESGSSKIKNVVAASFTQSQWQLVKEKIDFIEVEEGTLIDEILSNLRGYKQIDPVPTAENLLYWLQVTAEKQVVITSRDVFDKIESIAVYLSERIAIKDRYGIYFKPLHLSDLSSLDSELLKEEFYNGTSARYEHIQLGLDVRRLNLLDQIHEQFKYENTVILHGASGQGKSSLAYRYVFDNTPNSLIYELNVQQDPINTVESIVAMNSIVKSLEVSLIFIINVAPNTTSWLRIVHTFKNNKSVKFLITIRNEDWYRASTSGIEFSFSKIELILSREEAEQIYGLLEGKLGIRKYLNFTELWIELGNEVPLLELVYSIVQGDSLKNRLRQQISNIAGDENSNGGLEGQIHFLRIISLISAFDGHIDAGKIKKYPNILFIVEKFEREYLIKNDSSAKLLTGLHPVRSRILCELLFDNFSAEKRDFIRPSLQYIYDFDVFSFLIQSFFEQLIEPEDVLGILKDLQSIGWVYYQSVSSAFIWKGVYDYLLINKGLLYTVVDRFGDAWYMLVDLYHGNTYNPQTVLEFFVNGRQDLLEFINDVNSRLTDKNEVFVYCSKLFDSVSVPQIIPQTENDWRAFGEVLFWSGNVPNSSNKGIAVRESDFAVAFSEIGLETLAKLMLGMYYYSPNLNTIREKLAVTFTNRLRRQFNILLLTIDDEVSVNILYDFLRDKDSLMSQHQGIVNILEILRNAFPDKSKFRTQSHGHRLSTVPLDFDDSRKEVSVTSLPLSEWVNINATTRRLIEFELRPEGWREFIDELLTWESEVMKILKNFERSILSFKKNGEYSAIIPIIDQASYKSGRVLKIPRVVSDKFGLPTSMKSKLTDSGEQKERIFNDIYQGFLTAHAEFRSSIENFISQSGSTIYSFSKRKINSSYEDDKQSLYLSIINLYSACEKNIEYQKQKQKYFGHLVNGQDRPIQTDYLHLIATLWKTAVSAIESGDPKRILASEGITSLHEDFEVRLKWAFKSIVKSTGVSFRYLRGPNNNGAIFILSADTSTSYFLALAEYYNALHNIVSLVKFQSLKYLMFESKFSSFSFLPIVKGYSLDNKWHVFPLHVVKDKTFNTIGIHNVLSTDIEAQFIIKLKLMSWEEVHVKFVDLRTLKSEFASVLFLLDHLKDLKFFDENELDQEGLTTFQNHICGVGGKIQRSFQFVIDTLTEIINAYPLDRELYLVNEFEQKYWEYMFEIHRNIYPTGDSNPGNFELTLNVEMLGEWYDRLHKLFPTWGILTSMIHTKLVESGWNEV
ncbi:hypothetical protein [Dyadobacter arcticus]|uniref:Uncharacterized protein n=1 Tax=Dyadobacter arcticus TaxID=1078754 RepID=A0ABX0UHG7_9BACT|nr:hypothetical protein [Dyadobacter arcticus]NIJ52463.1 hypothetical protein [Dyadobacter arcticus]